MFDIGLGTLVTYNPLVVSAQATLDSVEYLFQQHDIRHAPVVDDQRQVVGIVSLLDVQQARAAHMAAAMLADAELEIRVRDVMKSPVVTVRSDDTPLTALQALLTHGFHSVPVVADDKLVGILTGSDFLRELCYGDDPLLREPLVKHILSEQAQIDADASLSEAGRQMQGLHVEYLAVTRANLPIGYVSQRDLMIAADVNELKCGDVASNFHKPTPIILRTAQLGDGMRALLEGRSKVVLVVDRQNRCRGLMSVRTALGAIAEAMQHEAAAVR